MPLNSGTRLGIYEIIAPLGAGGMGEVYRAKDTRLRREVAVKVLPASVASNPDFLARFEREARTVAGLNHPNIVTLYSVEDDGGIRFLTMELVEGRTLDQQITAEGLPLASVLGLAIPLADALVAAHGRGVVHRDLKPTNVMVTREGRVKVLDFGLAKVSPPASMIEATQASTMTSPMSAAGEMLGTLPYMAPEQIRGEAADARTDLFAFGILLYELVTGRRPFQGASPADVISSILRDAPPSIPSLRDDPPQDVARIIGRCLEKDPERRLQTAKDLRNELEIVQRRLEVRASQAPPFVASAKDAASIAVLPFANLGRDKDDDYFADGITEDVIAQLCKVRTLKVISRTSVMPFKKRDESIQEIASKLQVGNVLEGSVRRIGDRVRIVAQLIDAESGRHLWAETYDRQLTDVFAIQTDVALHISAALKAELSPDERERMHREPTRDVQAYELYLRGRQHLIHYTREDMLRSIEYFERAIGLDPGFALAYVGLAIAYTEMEETSEMSRAEAGGRATEAAASAVALDPELGDAHCARGYARLYYEYDWEGAEADFKRAIELSPSSAYSYDLYGRMCAALGRFDEAIALHERAFELDPLSNLADIATSLLRAGRNEEAAQRVGLSIKLEPGFPRLHATLGWALFRMGRTAEGLAELQQAVVLSQTGDMWLSQLGQACAMAGMPDRAREILQKLLDPSRPAPASPYVVAYVYTGLGDTERAMDCLERAFDAGNGALFAIKGSFLLAPLRDHPRFAALLARMRLT